MVRFLSQRVLPCLFLSATKTDVCYDWNAAVYNMERLKTEFNALNKSIGVKRKVSRKLHLVTLWLDAGLSTHSIHLGS